MMSLVVCSNIEFKVSYLISCTLICWQLKNFENGGISPYSADYTITLLKNVSYTTSPIYGGDIMMVYRFTNVTLNYEISQTGLGMISQQYRDFVQVMINQNFTNIFIAEFC